MCLLDLDYGRYWWFDLYGVGLVGWWEEEIRVREFTVF